MKSIFKVTGFLVGLLLLVGCSDGTGAPSARTAQQEAAAVAAEREVFVPQNDVEGQNYTDRLQIADDPTTILWCTSAFPVPASPLFTVPHVGKLTSGSKRPYSTTRSVNGIPGLGNSHTYSSEVAGPDGMYGSSAEYRYGFTPGGFYSEYTGLHTYCTTEPTVWQREQTTIVMESDPVLLEAHNAARQALADGDPEAAYDLLAAAINE